MAAAARFSLCRNEAQLLALCIQRIRMPFEEGILFCASIFCRLYANKFQAPFLFCMRPRIPYQASMALNVTKINVPILITHTQSHRDTECNRVSEQKRPINLDSVRLPDLKKMADYSLIATGLKRPAPLSMARSSVRTRCLTPVEPLFLKSSSAHSFLGGSCLTATYGNSR